MIKTLKRKLTSNTGASLTFALLLFVVCAAIGSIVLTAGTVASGRLANKTEMDERYYRVVSAVDMLKKELNDKEVTIVRKRDMTSGVPVYSLTFDGNYSNDFLTQRTLELLASKKDDNAMFISEFYNAGGDDNTNNFKFNVVASAESKVDIETKVEYGNMTIDISSEVEDPTKDKRKYLVRMTFTPVISEVYSVDGKVETKRATIKWVLNNVEKVSS